MSRPKLEVADIFRDHGAAWRAANAGHVSLDQLKVMSRSAAGVIARGNVASSVVLIWIWRSSRWVAKLWRNVCSVTPFLIPAASAASWNNRLRWRVVIGLPAFFLLGNSQRSGSGIPAS